MSIVKARRCTTASTRLAVAEKKRERERKISGILGAYAAGLMILILIFSCMYLRIEVPVVGYCALGSSKKAEPVGGGFFNN